ncbi:MAG: ribulose-phosphate 3-epimerase [Ignavibacteriaceae bacterium]|nr:ribulose-phosphate 3-epimerase [Ignavibacteriaceae bacterium]
MKILAPSILSADFTKLGEEVRNTELGGADWIHCDIMDGIFVPNISYGPMVVNAVNTVTNIPLDVHLMIKNPDALIPEFLKAGADYITVHFEEVIHLHRTINFIQSNKVKAGAAINPGVNVENLFSISEFCDLILIMSVNPGFGGQTFIQNTYKRIEKLANFRESNNLNFLIEVDGGVGKNNIKNLSDAGCDIFVAGASIFKGGNVINNTIELKSLIK